MKKYTIDLNFEQDLGLFKETNRLSMTMILLLILNEGTKLK